MAQHPQSALSPWRTVAILSVGLSVLASVIALAFTWTSVSAEPDNIPVALVVSDEQYEAASELAADAVITLRRVPDADTARAQVADRTFYGAIILTQEPEVIVASAASTVVSEELSALAPLVQELTPGGSALVTVTDVAPWADDDPTGAGFAVAGFPIILTGFLGGIGLSFIVHGRTRRLAAGTAYSILVACLLTAVFQGVLGILHGNPAVNALIICMTAASGTMLIAGLNSALGRIGIPLGVFFLLLLANPLSGFAIPAETYPSPWGDLGQWLAPGAASTLLRAESYFPAQNTIQPWLILSSWVIVGIALILSRSGTAVIRPGRRGDSSDQVST